MDAAFSNSQAYKWKPVLHNLYVVQNMTDSEIADTFGVSKSTVTYHRNKHSIEGRTPKEYASLRPATLEQTKDGYVYWNANTADEYRRVYVHRLLAVAEYGIENVKSHEVHHTNGMTWDNRADNIELMTEEEHKREHAEQRRDNKTGRFQ